MTIGQSMLPEFDQEMGNTRKMLERIPEVKLAYKPDPRSWSMIPLASHVAEMVGFVPEGFKPFVAASGKEVLDKFDEWVKDARAAIAGVGDQALMQERSLRFRGNPINPPMPRVAVLRSASRDTAHRDIQGPVERVVVVQNPEGGRSTSDSLALL